MKKSLSIAAALVVCSGASFAFGHDNIGALAATTAVIIMFAEAMS